MRTQKMLPDFFSDPGKLRNLLGRFGCAVVIGAQYLLVAGLIGIPITANTFIVMLLAEILLIFSLRELILINTARDLLDLNLYGLFYWVSLYIAYKMKLSWYSDLGSYRDPLAKFFFIAYCLRIFWVVRLPNSETYYAWPIIGPVSWFFARKSAEPVVRHLGHSLLVYGLILAAALYTFLCPKLPHEENIKQALGGALGFILFFRFFRPFMKGNIALVEENIQYRTSEEKLASLIMAVQTQAGGKLNPELIKTMCHFAQLDDRTQLILAATIADVAKSIVLPANQSTYDDGDEPPAAE